MQDNEKRNEPKRDRGYQFGRMLAKGTAMAGYGIIISAVSVITSQAILEQTNAQTREILTQRRKAEEDFLRVLKATVYELEKAKGYEKLIRENNERDLKFQQELEQYRKGLEERNQKPVTSEAVSPLGGKVISIPGIKIQAPQVMPELEDDYNETF